MKTSPLYETHKSLGAGFMEIDGWEIPAHYGDPVAEHLHVRKSAGIMDLSCRGKVRISGKDRSTFLQRILSQDVNKISPGTWAYSTLLDVKGRMLAWMRIYNDSDDSFLVDMEPGLADKVIRILTHYLFREDVQVVDATEELGIITVHGPLAGKVLEKIAAKNLENTFIKRDSRQLGEEGYDIYVPWNGIKDLWNTFIKEGTDDGLRPFGYSAFNTLRIEAGTPLYFVDMDEHTIPLEADLEKAISYDKGCYVGQETISRIKFRGHVSRILTGLVIDGTQIPEKGDSIFIDADDADHAVGFITSSCHSPTLRKPIALGYIRTAHNQPGKTVYIERAGQRLMATITLPPFHR